MINLLSREGGDTSNGMVVIRLICYLEKVVIRLMEYFMINLLSREVVIRLMEYLLSREGGDTSNLLSREGGDTSNGIFCDKFVI